MTTAAFPAPLPGGVLVASPSAQLRDRVLSTLDPGRGPVFMASGGGEALAKLDTGNWQMLILDRQLPDLDAEELAGITERLHPGIRVRMVDSWSDDASDPRLSNRNHDSPSNSESNFYRAASAPALRALLTTVTTSLEAPLAGMIGDTEPMRHLYRMVRLVAPRNTTVLVTGPTGSGKSWWPAPFIS